MSELSRREVLKIGALAGGLLVGVRLPGCASQRIGPQGELTPNAWIKVGVDDRITFILDRVEMGQGVMTSHAMIVAEELFVTPESLTIELATADRKYDNPLLGFQVTGGSTSVVSSWDALRNAAATTREALRAAAAERLGLRTPQLRPENGAFVGPNGVKVRYGEVATAAADHLQSEFPPKHRSDYQVIGRSRQRLDALAKVTGRAEFGIDVRRTDLLTAVIVRGPFGVQAKEASALKMKNIGAELISFDAKEAEALPGVKAVLRVPTGIAVVADTYWHAQSAAARMRVEWAKSPLDDALIDSVLGAALAREGKGVRDDGDSERALASAEKVIEARYELPYLAHAPMEPQNCTAHVHESGVDVWAPTQSPGAARSLAARIADVSESVVRVHPTLVGGGFGRRLEQDYVAEAVDLSKRLGRAVKVIWSRPDDLGHSMYRPASRHLVKVGVRAGQPCGWFHRLAVPSILAHVAPNWGRNSYPSMPGFVSDLLGSLFAGTMVDDTSVEGAKDLPYAIDDLRVEWGWADPGVPLGFFRSVGHSFTAFVVETMMDELAVAAGRDPYELRRTLLAQHPRRRAVLDLVAAKAQCGAPLPAGHHVGIAQHHSFGSTVAQVVELSVEHGELKIHRVVAAADCGTVINPDIVRSQIESGIIFGLSAALYGQINFHEGWVTQTNYHQYPVLRMFQCPAIEVHLIESDQTPSGIGEPGVPPVMGALANAYFRATGQRVRKLPLFPAG